MEPMGTRAVGRAAGDVQPGAAGPAEIAAGPLRAAGPQIAKNFEVLENILPVFGFTSTEFCKYS